MLFEHLARVVFAIISLSLMVVTVGLIINAGLRLATVFDTSPAAVGAVLLDAIGYLIISIAVFEVAKYLFEEEVMDPTEMRHTGEARRSMTKFISTIAIAVFLEALVAIFQSSQDKRFDEMLYPTILLFGGVTLIVGLGVYQRLSAAAEREVRRAEAEAATARSVGGADAGDSERRE